MTTFSEARFDPVEKPVSDALQTRLSVTDGGKAGSEWMLSGTIGVLRTDPKLGFLSNPVASGIMIRPSNPKSDAQLLSPNGSQLVRKGTR
jgi:hypothetical protein